MKKKKKSEEEGDGRRERERKWSVVFGDDKSVYFSVVVPSQPLACL